MSTAKEQNTADANRETEQPLILSNRGRNSKSGTKLVQNVNKPTAYLQQIDIKVRSAGEHKESKRGTDRVHARCKAEADRERL